MSTMGDSRKYLYHTTDGFHILTPPLPSEFPKRVIPPCPRISIIVNPPSRSDFPFFRHTLKATYLPNFGYFTEKYYFLITLLLFCTSTTGYRGSRPDSESSGMKIFKKIKRFLLTAVQQTQPPFTLHCPKLVKNIKIRISCDERVSSRKIIRSSISCFCHLEFEPSGSAVTPNLTSLKWRPRSKTKLVSH